MTRNRGVLLLVIGAVALMAMAATVSRVVEGPTASPWTAPVSRLGQDPPVPREIFAALHESMNLPVFAGNTPTTTTQTATNPVTAVFRELAAPPGVAKSPQPTTSPTTRPSSAGIADQSIRQPFWRAIDIPSADPNALILRPTTKPIVAAASQPATNRLGAIASPPPALPTQLEMLRAARAAYLSTGTPPPPSRDHLARGNAIAAGLYSEGATDDAAELFATIQPEAAQFGFGDVVELNLALSTLQSSRKHEAIHSLKEIIDGASPPQQPSTTSRPDAATLIGVRVVACGVLAGLAADSRNPDEAQRYCERAIELASRSSTDYASAQDVWPGVYTAAARAWSVSLRIQRPKVSPDEAAGLVKSFVASVPLNRWTWPEHEAVQNALGRWRDLHTRPSEANDNLDAMRSEQTPPRLPGVAGSAIGPAGEAAR